MNAVFRWGQLAFAFAASVFAATLIAPAPALAQSVGMLACDPERCVRCDLRVPETPYKAGPNTILYTDGVACDGPVRTIDITLELYRTDNFSTNPATGRLANFDRIRRPFEMNSNSNTIISVGVGDRTDKVCANGRYFGKTIAAVTFRNGETLRQNRSTVPVALSCANSQTPEPPGPVFNPGTTPATNIPDRTLTVPELIRRVIGLPQQAAIDRIIHNGQQVGTIRTEENADFVRGEVSGATNESGPNTIDLTISSGPAVLRTPSAEISQLSPQVITWPAVPLASFYQVFYLGGGLAAQVTGTSAGFNAPRCEPTERFVVRACSAEGCSNFSNTLSITPPCSPGGGGGGRF